jgi:hypothetical protein
VYGEPVLIVARWFAGRHVTVANQRNRCGGELARLGLGGVTWASSPAYVISLTIASQEKAENNPVARRGNGAKPLGPSSQVAGQPAETTGEPPLRVNLSLQGRYFTVARPADVRAATRSHAIGLSPPLRRMSE